MSDPIQQVDIRFYRENTTSDISEPVIREKPVEILLNGKRITTIACTGIHLKELATGYLRSMDLLTIPDGIERVAVSSDGSRVDVLTMDTTIPLAPPSDPIVLSSGSRARQPETGGNRISSDIFLSAQKAITLMEELLTSSELHRLTHGTHCSALADTEQILALRDDIGRHNTIDMLGGYALLNGIDCSDKIIVKTGRVSSEIARKVWALGIPIMISHSVPTSEALDILHEAGITLIGHVRGKSFKIYTNERRIRF